MPTSEFDDIAWTRSSPVIFETQIRYDQRTGKNTDNHKTPFTEFERGPRASEVREIAAENRYRANGDEKRVE